MKNIPNILSFIRLLMIPVFVYVDDGNLFIGYDTDDGGIVYKTVLEKR